MTDTRPPHIVIAKFLEKKGITQESLSERLGITQSNVAHWVVGKRPIPIDKALDIEHFYGLDAESLNPRVADLCERVARRVARRGGGMRQE